MAVDEEALKNIFICDGRQSRYRVYLSARTATSGIFCSPGKVNGNGITGARQTVAERVLPFRLGDDLSTLLEKDLLRYPLP
jgi:hypothetical protein